MAATTENPLELILQLCSAAAPSPWYPSAYAKAAGISRESIDPHLDRLRLAALIRLTDWMPGTGQGYVLTPEGTKLLANPRSMSLLRSGNLRLDVQAPEPPLLDDSATKLFARGDAVREVFMVQTPARATYALIFANLLVFAYGLQLAKQGGVPMGEYLGTENLLGGQRLTEKLVAVFMGEGALRGVDLVRGEWWRLITSLFVHLGIVHLAVNLYSLYVIGPLTERMWGSVRFAVIYLLAGFGGSCAMAYFTPPSTVGAGASGAIWGLMTSLITWLLLNRAHMPRPFLNNMLRRLSSLVLLNVFISFVPGVSASAHFGGGAAAVAASILMHGNRYGKGILKYVSTIGLVLFPVACFGALALAQRSDPSWEKLDYNQRRVPEMEAAEERAKNIISSKLQPLWLRQLQALTEQELRGAIQAQKDAVQSLMAGEKAARAAPKYRDPEIERFREANAQIFERRVGHVERSSWQLLISPAARDETRAAGRVFRQKAQPLLKLPPAARDNESVLEAQTLLQEQVAKLDGIRELLELLGPLQSDQALEESRKQEIEDLAFCLELLKAAATGLKEGAAWPDDKRREYEQLEAKAKS